MYHLRGYEFSMRLKRLNFISSLCSASTAASSSSYFFIFMSFSLKFRSLSSFLGVTIKYITIFVPIDTDLLNAHALFSPSHCFTMSLIYVVHTPEHSPHACSPQEEKKEEYLYVMFLSLLRAFLIHFLKFVHKLKT